MKKLIILAFATIILSACSVTLPVDGKLLRSNDRFLGEATGYMDRTGIMLVTSLNGKKCTGSFEYLTSATGKGIFNCDDNRTGTFLFNSNGYRGNGMGKLNDGEEFAFAFGDPAHTKDFRE